MKKVFLIICIHAILGTVAYAQDCYTGFCPSSITVHHKAGLISPTTGDITYNVISTTAFGAASGGYCLLDRNLGVTTLPTSVSDYTNGTGWFFQFGRSKGWASLATITAGLTTYTTAYATPSVSWSAANDPCALLIGPSWRIPTQAEGVGFTTGAPTPTTLYTSWKMSTTSYINQLGTAITSSIVSQYWLSTYNSATMGYVAYAATATGTYSITSGQYYNCGLPVRCIKNFAN